MSNKKMTGRIRSPSYPCIDLESAIDKVGKLYNFGKLNPVLVSVILPQWGFNSKSTNGMKVVAALKSFGLIDDSGQKEQRKIKLTNRAYRILKDHSNSKEREQAIKDAALDPEIYSWCWNRYGELEEMPDDEAVRSELIFDKKFNESAVKGFLIDYKDSIKYSKLTKNDNLDVGEDEKTGIPTEEIKVVESSKQDSALTSHQKVVTQTNPGEKMLQDVVNLNDGQQVIIQYPSDLTPENYEDFTDWLLFQHKKIGRSVESSSKPKLMKEDGKDETG